MSKTIGIVVGSIRAGSFSQAVANYVASQLPEGYQAKFIKIADLPLYNQDYDAASPESYTVFRDEVKSVDAYIFVTPEHNRSIPAALKNALDIASRPYGENVWSGKPAGVISQSPGAIAGFGANHHLRQVLSFLDVYTMAQPEAYIGSVMDGIDESGSINSEGSLAEFLQMYAGAFVSWVEKFK